MDKQMTNKQRVFCQEYLVDLNATQAAVRAGYSEATARSVGSENLTKPDIQGEIAKLQRERSDRTQVTADSVVADLALIKTECMADKNYVPALRALELLGKHLGMFKDEVSHTHEILSDDERDRRIDAILDGARKRRDAAATNGEVH